MILENATYTAAEVKVLTADACKFAHALGRKEALEEAEAAIERLISANHDNSIHQGLFQALSCVQEAAEEAK